MPNEPLDTTQASADTSTLRSKKDMPSSVTSGLVRPSAPSREGSKAVPRNAMTTLVEHRG